MTDVKTMGLDIVSAEASIFSGEVQTIVVTGLMGELGIHPGHTPLLTSLKPGEVEAVFADGKADVFYISGGMLEVQPDTVTVLADRALRAADLDEAAARAAKESAEKTIENQKSGIEYSRALADLAESLAQLRAIKNLKKRSGRSY